MEATTTALTGYATISWPSFVLGIIIGFVMGMGVMRWFNKGKFPGDHLLAWFIALNWIGWHTSVALGFVEIVPPTIYDLVSGGAVGFILGERFWDGLGNLVRRK